MNKKYIGLFSFGFAVLMLALVGVTTASALTIKSAEVTVSPKPFPSGSCAPIVHYLKFGQNNNLEEVRKLQVFLKEVENLDVDVNTIFDIKTKKAVEAFQLKYKDDVMKPWGATIPTGEVYISTLKKINELNCKNPLTFTDAEREAFMEFKNQKALGMVTADGKIIKTDDSDDEEGDDVTATTSVKTKSGTRIGNFFSGIWKFLFRK